MLLKIETVEVCVGGTIVTSQVRLSEIGGLSLAAGTVELLRAFDFFPRGWQFELNKISMTMIILSIAIIVLSMVSLYDRKRMRWPLIVTLLTAVLLGYSHVWALQKRVLLDASGLKWSELIWVVAGGPILAVAATVLWLREKPNSV